MLEILKESIKSTFIYAKDVLFPALFTAFVAGTILTITLNTFTDLPRIFIDILSTAVVWHTTSICITEIEFKKKLKKLKDRIKILESNKELKQDEDGNPIH
jgi:hypothetical protein